jgi:type IV secretion system protein VirB10
MSALGSKTEAPKAAVAPRLGDVAREREASVAPASPDGFRLDGEPPQVMRLSRKALAIIGGTASFAIAGALIYAFQPGAPKRAPNVYESDTPNKSEVVTGAPADYSKVPKLGEPLSGDLGRAIPAARKEGEMIPAPTMTEPSPVDPRAAAIEQNRARLAQERDAARSSRLFLAGAQGTGEGPAIPAEESPRENSSAGQAAAQTVGQRMSFRRSRQGGATENPARLSMPSSPYVVQAGSVIPAALITGIQSDLPGQITAQVTQNVFDSLTGRVLLIPQGARLVGTYDSDIVAGQNRVLLAWDRLIFPDGRSLDLARQPGADASGMAGLADRTYRHWCHTFKAALVSALLGVGAEVGSDGDDRLVRALRDGSQDTIGEVGRQIVSRHLAIPPTITVRPGFVFRVIVTRDLVLEPISGGMS